MHAASDATDIAIPGTPQCVVNMTDAELEQRITLLRERRLSARKKFERDEQLKAAARTAKDKDKLDKHLAKLSKQLDAVDSALEKAENTLSALRVLRFELTGVIDDA